MRSQTLVYAIAASAVLFVSGIAVGQRTSTSKFAKYLRPAIRSDMDLITLEASVNAIRANIPWFDGMAIPQVFFNYKEDQLQASIEIASEFEKAPLDTVKSRIIQRYYMTFGQLKAYVPELSEDDFVLRVVRITTDPDRKLFAECRRGNIVFH